MSDEVLAPPAEAIPRIPYGFARRHGLVPTGATDGRLEVAIREGADPKALIELRRALARPFTLRKVDAPAFDRLLSDLYTSGTEAAADAQAAAARRYNYVRGHQLIANPNREPTLDELVRDYLGAVPPQAPEGPQPQDQMVTPAEAQPRQ